MNGVDLSTTYLGLELDSPLVPSASPLSRSLDTCRRLEDAGAAAIVMYSLFEEELRHDEELMSRFLIDQELGHMEASSFLPLSDRYQRGSDQYLEQLAALKESLDIPVIASLNGVSVGGWIENGRQLQEAGADALELNAYYVAADPARPGTEVEALYVELLAELRQQVSLPVTMKLPLQFSAIPHFVRQLEQAGANGIALFNRFYQPDIDPDTLRVTPHLQLSTSADALVPMRWIAILYGRVGLSLAATGGIYTAQDVLKMVLAGADVTHLCSALLVHGPQQLLHIKADLEAWMEDNGYESITELKGRVSQQHVADPAAFERANYLWVLDSYSPAKGVRR